MEVQNSRGSRIFEEVETHPKGVFGKLIFSFQFRIFFCRFVCGVGGGGLCFYIFTRNINLIEACASSCVRVQVASRNVICCTSINDDVTLT